MADILLIGGSGFVGSALVPALQVAGHHVTLLNRGTSLMAGTHQLIADRDDARAMQSVAGSYDAVIDTSAYTPTQTKIAFTGFGGQCGQWIQLSSAAVYQPTEGRFPSEADATGGAAVWGGYGVDKSDCDAFLLSQDICPVTILRPPYLYGPNNAYDRETYVWARALTGRPIIVPGQGKAPLQFLHVQDLAQVIVRLLDQKATDHRVYNIADPTVMPSRDWVRMLSAMTGQDVSVLSGGKLVPHRPAREYFPFRDVACALDVSHIQNALDWQPLFNIEAGFRQTFDSYDPGVLAKISPILDAEVEILALQ